MALDYGLSRIGVAISDELGLMAHPRPFVPAKPPARAYRQIKSLALESEVVGIVVGLPINMDGTEGLSARRARKFAQEIETFIGRPVHLVDERLSTVAAQGLLHDAGRKAKDSRAHIDSASAASLLQSWLGGR
jgi:putative Holliday junction resolvase